LISRTRRSWLWRKGDRCERERCYIAGIMHRNSVVFPDGFPMHQLASAVDHDERWSASSHFPMDELKPTLAKEFTVPGNLEARRR
jgi:hypothetical protein